MKYMGTREEVEKLPTGIDHSPATKKQDDLIASIVKKYPAFTEYLEYIEYQQRKEKASATEFIDAFVERNSDRIGCSISRVRLLGWGIILLKPAVSPAWR